MCHVNCLVHIYGILPRKIIKTLEKACQNYNNYNLITDVFQPDLFGHARRPYSYGLTIGILLVPFH